MNDENSQDPLIPNEESPQDNSGAGDSVTAEVRAAEEVNPLEGFSDGDLLRELVRRNGTSVAPSVTRRYEDHQEALIAIGADFCAHLTFDKPALRALQRGDDRVVDEAADADGGS